MKTPAILFSLLLTLPAVKCFAFNKVGANGQCPVLDDEVCGVNNITYQNACYLQRAGVARAYDGWCINGQNNNSPATFNPGLVIDPPSTLPSAPAIPTNIDVAFSGSQLIITQWWRNEHNGYLSPGERYVGCPCNDSLLPVCGSNGMTYANMCRAECANIKAVKYGECGDYNYQWPGPQSCLCSFEIDTSNSVCGVNQRTYESKCVAKCVNTPVAGGGFCKNKCNCDHYFKPVCGRDGATYDNECKSDCLKIEKLHEGICNKDSVDQCFFCQGLVKKVCGNDDKTYDNECYMTCRGAQKKKDGACPLKKGEKCHCLDVELPVCGIDDVTYKNECELNCKGIPKKGNKPCYLYHREMNSCKNKCRDQKYNPVCGSNGMTYNNRCDAGCGGMSIITNGPCGSAKNTTHCVCSDEPMPVCGVDGRDYLNKCALECAGVSLAWEGPCSMHKSQSGALYKTGQITAGGPIAAPSGRNIFTPTAPQTPLPMGPPAPMPAPMPAPAPAPVPLAPTMQEIQQMINIKLAQQANHSPTIVVLPQIPQSTQKEPINVTLQFVNPDGTKTEVNNDKVMTRTLGKSDFYEEECKDCHDMTQRIRLKMDHQMSLEKLFTLISLQPKSFYSYFNGMINKGVVTRSSIMFKGLSLGKLLSYIENQFGIANASHGQITVGNSK